MKKNKKAALEILEIVCKVGCAQKMYDGLYNIVIDDKRMTEIMVEFFKPVSREWWGIHFVAFLSYQDFLLKRER